ncbi:hypothetical protein OSTOST_13652, partial [Ostertagia ostertagi]
MALPKSWRGLRDAELSDVSGIPGCIFVHTTGFIGGNETLEGALSMARKALEIGDAERAEEILAEMELKKPSLESSMDQSSETVPQA